MWFMLTPCLPSGGLEFWHMLVTWLAPNGSFVLSEPPSWTDAPHVLSQLVLEELSASRVTPLGEDPGKLVHGLLQALSHPSLPVADFALKPSAVINYSSGYHCLMNSLSHWTRRWSGGPPLSNLPILKQIMINHNCGKTEEEREQWPLPSGIPASEKSPPLECGLGLMIRF